MQQDTSRKRIVIVTALFAIVLIAIAGLVIFFMRDTGENQFGGRIRIQNFDAKVKNVTPEMRDAIESYLYNIVKLNSNDSFNPSTVKDAMIRDSTEYQSYAATNGAYSGGFIIDMASIKQSYQGEYTQASREDGTVSGGNPVVISCLPVDQLKYGEFGCKDLVSNQSAANSVLMQYLPYKTFSFAVTPDATRSDKMTLVVDLTIPQIDLSGDAASKRAAVAMYKKEVTDWISSKGADPDAYLYAYNYDDNGNKIENRPIDHNE